MSKLTRVNRAPGRKKAACKPSNQRNRKSRKPPLIGISAALENFVLLLAQKSQLTFEDALNVVLRVGAQQLSSLMVAEQLFEALNNPHAPGLVKDVTSLSRFAEKSAPDGCS